MTASEISLAERPVVRLARLLGCTDGQAWTLLVGLVLALVVMLTGLPPTLRDRPEEARAGSGPGAGAPLGPGVSGPGTPGSGPGVPGVPGAPAGTGGPDTLSPTSPTSPTGGGPFASPPRPSALAYPGLPDGAPRAAFVPERALPVPAGWPFPESFPRTSGTGRLDAGAFYWSDFLYDDHGATGQGAKWYHGQYRTSGTYSYPPGPAASPGNGIGADNAADIFRVAVGLDTAATYWRVDWNTLLDPRHPVAAFGIDLNPGVSAPAVDWPGVADLRSAGVDVVLLVSSRGAWLVRPDGRVRIGDTTVDLTARSFVVRVPRGILPAAGRWRIQVVSGVADGSGEGFAPVGPDLGGAAGMPPVYNVSFRRSDQEMAKLRELQGAKVRGLYTDRAQAEVLTTGDITAFAADVSWASLAARQRTPEPLVRGPSNRWYVSSIELGQGVVNTFSGFSDVKPNLLGRVQPYTVWVPARYDVSRPAALTMLIHPNGSTHNEYVDSPKLMQAACEDAASICVTPAGRSPDQTPADEMELDFWEVWRAVAAAYRLDAERTRLFGFSQGGGVANHLVMTYPDLFARAAVFAPGCCGDDDRVANLRWVPIFLGEPTADPTVLYAVPEADRLSALGYRHRLEVYPDQDHASFGYKDHYTRGARYLGDGTVRRTTMPGRLTYIWSHALDRPDLGIGVQGAYWLRTPRSRNAELTSRVDATSHAQPDPAVTTTTSTPVVTDDPSPAAVTELTWTMGARPVPRSALDLTLVNVGEVTLRLALAGLVRGRAASVAVTTDGAAVVVLRDLRPGVAVSLDGGRPVIASRDGVAILHLDRTSKTIRIGGA